MSLWVRIIAVKEDGKEKFLGDRWNSKHKCYTSDDPESESEDWTMEIDLEKLPPGTKKIKIEGIP
jgi:hypothetical protein